MKLLLVSGVAAGMEEEKLAALYDKLKSGGPKGKSGLGFKQQKKKEDEEQKPATSPAQIALMAKYGGFVAFQKAGTAKDVARQTFFNSDDEGANGIAQLLPCLMAPS